MAIKRYCRLNRYTKHHVVKGIQDDKIPKQMLVGYMLEYLSEKENLFYLSDVSDINKIYDYLKGIINE
jgi:hypothetical protein